MNRKKMLNPTEAIAQVVRESKSEKKLTASFDN